MMMYMCVICIVTVPTAGIVSVTCAPNLIQSSSCQCQTPFTQRSFSGAFTQKKSTSKAHKNLFSLKSVNAFTLGQCSGRVVKKRPSSLKLMESTSKAPEKLFKSAQCSTGSLQAPQCEGPFFHSSCQSFQICSCHYNNTQRSFCEGSCSGTSCYSGNALSPSANCFPGLSPGFTYFW